MIAARVLEQAVQDLGRPATLVAEIEERSLASAGALPKRSWIERLRRLGLGVLVPLWRYAASKSEARRSRWQWT